MGEVLYDSDGKVLAFCRSGTRSTYLWALARSRKGDDAGAIGRKAAEAGYDLTPIRPYLGRSPAQPHPPRPRPPSAEPGSSQADRRVGKERVSTGHTRWA